MASTTPLLTQRDFELFRAVDRGPLTVRQLLKLSATFTTPFRSERRLQDRLYILTRAGLLRRGAYATTDSWMQFYYTLSPTSFRLIYGMGTPLPSGGAFAAVGIARQRHTRCLAEFLVHTLVAAQASGVAVADFFRENAQRLAVGDDSLYPDATFSLVVADRPSLHFFVELDTGTEPVTSPRERDSWERKVRFYERYQDARPQRFRVLAVTTGGATRLENILTCAASLARNPHRSLVYGITLANFIKEPDALTTLCFRNHRAQAAALVPTLCRLPVVPRTAPRNAATAMLTSAPCHVPLRQV